MEEGPNTLASVRNHSDVSQSGKERGQQTSGKNSLKERGTLTLKGPGRTAQSFPCLVPPLRLGAMFFPRKHGAHSQYVNLIAEN